MLEGHPMSAALREKVSEDPGMSAFPLGTTSTSSVLPHHPWMRMLMPPVNGPFCSWPVVSVTE